jgi:predicted RNA-binding Zn ribbon-like protein
MAANPPALFIADDRGLDFLNSIATLVDVPIDWIADGPGFVDWLAQAGLVPADELRRVVERATPGELDRVAGQARDLREWFRAFVRSHAGRAIGSDPLAELAPLNRLLERDEAYERIIARDNGQTQRHLALETMRRWRSAEALLIPVGEAIAHVVVEEDFSDIKACEGQRCTLLFVDRTRARARRWCSMRLCGNRAKVAAHRQRRRGA